MVEESEEKIGKCQLKECTWNSDQKCAEGFTDDIDNCPNIKWETISNEDENTTQQAKDKIPETESKKAINLFSGTAMTIAQGREISSSYNTKLIQLVGPVGSGKTTIINGIYEKFREGPFAGFLFSGSKTLIGFERNCHPSRIASDRETPETKRTRIGDDEFLLHFCLKKEEIMEKEEHLLICDLSGELFESGQMSNENLKNIPLISRVDQFVIVFDGDNIANTIQRQKTKYEGLMFLRAAVEQGFIDNRVNLDVVFSRQDIVLNSPNKDEANKFQETIKKEITQSFSTKLKNIRFFNVAALPKMGGYERGHGLDDLLTSWYPEYHNYSVKRNYQSHEKDLQNEFDKFLWKTMDIDNN